MDERRESLPREDADGLRGPDGRISLRRLDELIQGTLPRAEAEALHRALASDETARAYYERQSALQSRRDVADFREAYRRRSRFPLLARLLATVRMPGSGNRGVNPWLPRPGLAAVFAALLLGASLWIGRWDPAGSPDPARFRAKGASRPEIALKHGGDEFSPGALVPAGSGDTLALAYASADSLYVQVWYQEDGGHPSPMTGPGGFVLPPAASWTEARQRIRLEGTWKRQQMWILLSREALGAERATRLIRRGRGDRDADLATYRLSDPRGD